MIGMANLRQKSVPETAARFDRCTPGSRAALQCDPWARIGGRATSDWLVTSERDQSATPDATHGKHAIDCHPNKEGP